MKKLILVVLFFTVFGGGLWWFREPILFRVGKWLVVETPLREADLVVALGGSRERQEKAVELLKQGFAQRVLFTGPDFRPQDYACLGIHQQGIEPPLVAYRTYDDALVTKKVIEREGFRSAIIVTSPYHLRRTRLIFTKVFGDGGVRLTFYPSLNRAFSTDNWWKSYFGRQVILFEYAKLIYYMAAF